MVNPISDGRRQRGDRTRRTLAVRAAERASIEGLDGLSLGNLAADLQISKGGVQAAYASKEELQVAAVAAATEIFVREVVTPVLGEPRGLRRLWALIESWLAYVDRRVLPGGCFMAATVPEFDSRPGAVRDALAEARHGWLGLLEHEIRHAQDQRDLPDDLPPHLLAFEVDALLTMANNVCNLADQAAPLDAGRAVLVARLGPDPRTTRGRAVHSRRSRSSSLRAKGAER